MLIGLDGPHLIVLWWTFPAYPALIGGAVLLGAAILIWDTRRSWRPARAADSVLLALLLGLIFARAGHVLLNLAYFSAAQDEIFQLTAGGLDPHGAILGAALGGYIAARRFEADYAAWLGGAAFALPLIALTAWWGCAAAACAYGAEVANLADYPAWLVWEAAGDFTLIAPRYAVQPIGAWISFALILVLAAASYLGLRSVRRAGFALAAVMLSALLTGFLRGDTTAYRDFGPDFWLNVIFLVAGAGLALGSRRPDAPAA